MRWELVEKLCGLSGVSGCEDQVRYELMRQIEGRCIYKTDALGNLLAFKKGKETPGRKVLFTAHMDEPGLILTFVEDSGLLRFSIVGTMDCRVLTGKRVSIASGGGGVFGVIGTKAMHQKNPSEREKVLTAQELFIDIGAGSREEALTKIALGDRAVLTSHFSAFGDGLMRGRALESRLSCALLVQLIESDLKYDTHFAFTVQGETGFTGGITAAAQIAPDLVVTVGTSEAWDIPSVEKDKALCSLRQGPVLSFMDQGAVYDKALFQEACRIAGENDIPFQIKTGVFGKTDARTLMTAGNGARAASVSVPCRYPHTSVNVICQRDADAALALLEALSSGWGR